MRVNTLLTIVDSAMNILLFLPFFIFFRWWFRCMMLSSFFDWYCRRYMFDAATVTSPLIFAAADSCWYLCCHADYAMIFARLFWLLFHWLIDFSLRCCFAATLLMSFSMLSIFMLSLLIDAASIDYYALDILCCLRLLLDASPFLRCDAAAVSDIFAYMPVFFHAVSPLIICYAFRRFSAWCRRFSSCFHMLDFRWLIFMLDALISLISPSSSIAAALIIRLCCRLRYLRLISPPLSSLSLIFLFYDFTPLIFRHWYFRYYWWCCRYAITPFSSCHCRHFHFFSFLDAFSFCPYAIILWYFRRYYFDAADAIHFFSSYFCHFCYWFLTLSFHTLIFDVFHWLSFRFLPFFATTPFSSRCFLSPLCFFSPWCLLPLRYDAIDASASAITLLDVSLGTLDGAAFWLLSDADYYAADYCWYFRFHYADALFRAFRLLFRHTIFWLFSLRDIFWCFCFLRFITLADAAICCCFDFATFDVIFFRCLLFIYFLWCRCHALFCFLRHALSFHAYCWLRCCLLLMLPFSLRHAFDAAFDFAMLIFWCYFYFLHAMLMLFAADSYLFLFWLLRHYWLFFFRAFALIVYLLRYFRLLLWCRHFHADDDFLRCHISSSFFRARFWCFRFFFFFDAVLFSIHCFVFFSLMLTPDRVTSILFYAHWSFSLRAFILSLMPPPFSAIYFRDAAFIHAAACLLIMIRWLPFSCRRFIFHFHLYFSFIISLFLLLRCFAHFCHYWCWYYFDFHWCHFDIIFLFAISFFSLSFRFRLRWYFLHFFSFSHYFLLLIFIFSLLIYYSMSFSFSLSFFIFADAFIFFPLMLIFSPSILLSFIFSDDAAIDCYALFSMLSIFRDYFLMLYLRHAILPRHALIFWSFDEILCFAFACWWYVFIFSFTLMRLSLMLSYAALMPPPWFRRFIDHFATSSSAFFDFSDDFLRFSFAFRCRLFSPMPRLFSWLWCWRYFSLFSLMLLIRLPRRLYHDNVRFDYAMRARDSAFEPRYRATRAMRAEARAA